MRFLLLAISLSLAGCLGNQPARRGASEQNGSDTTAAGALARADRSALDQAIARLANYDYEQDRRIVVSDESGRLMLRYGYRTVFSGSPERRTADVRDTTLAGEGSAGLWKEFAGSPSVEDTLEWGTRLLSDDALVLTRRGTAYYRYREQPDTTIGGAVVRRIDADGAPGTSRAGIQSGRFYVSADSGKLVGFDVNFTHRSLLFDEESRFRYLLQRAGDDAWLPLEVTVNTFLNLPLTKGQRFELHARYADPVRAAG